MYQAHLQMSRLWSARRGQLGMLEKHGLWNQTDLMLNSKCGTLGKRLNLI